MGINQKYVRDKRSPVPTSDKVSKIMSANPAKNTKPELLLRKTLRESKLSGYRLHPNNVTGRPDICYKSKKVAIFVHGCYWHRCPKCDLPLPKSNTDFWDQKFQRNKIRDDLKTKALEEEGWQVLTFWECELKSSMTNVAKKVKFILAKQKNAH